MIPRDAMTYGEGTTVGPYEIRQHLGSGGMGDVYRASDSRLSRDVAIKIVSRLDPSHAARFDAEVRAVAGLAHPHIVSIFDVGEIDGRPYAVMEMLDGETLRARINRTGALAESDVVAFGVQIASALDAAHARQIVHRDVKPENIFVLGTGTVKLVDFGLAAAMQPDDILATRLTAQGLVVGTVGYMAPEQARGATIDARTDVFSCGAVLFEMATGRPAFPGSSAVEVLTAIISGVRPSFNAAPVSQWLQSIVVRCLHSDPSARFRSAAELRSALERGLAAASPLPSAERPAQLTSIAVLPFADMSRDRDQDYLCEGIAEELITALNHISGLKVASRTAAFRFRGSAVDVSHAGLALGVECVLEGSVRTAGNRLRVTTRLTQAHDGYLLWSHQFDRSLDDIFAVQDEIARTVVQTLRPAQPPASTMIETATATTEAYTEYLKGRFHWNRRTEKDLDAAVVHFSRSIAIEPSFARGHAGLGDALATQGLYGLRRPADVMSRAKASALRAVELNPELADGYVPLALVEAVYEWTWEDSERHFLEAAALARDDSTALHWYASNLLVPNGRFDEARAALARAAAADPVSLPIGTSRGVLAFYERRFEEARDLLRATLALDPSFAPAHFFLAQVLAELGDVDTALGHGERASALADRPPETVAALGVVAARAGDRSRAGQCLAELQATAERRFVSPGLAAQIHAALGADDDACAALERALTERTPDLAWIAVRPVFATLRSNDRFQRLVSRVGIRRS
jgi:eukaryotic-like serine/threonine-protein kinase